MEEIHRIIDALRMSDLKSVLATIIHVEGSAYRKEGTSMLFQENGTKMGTLSAGCLETDLSIRAEEIMEAGSNQILVYDMSSEDDLSWGQGTGCNGSVYVLLEKIDYQRKKNLLTLKSCLDQGKKVLFINRLTHNLQRMDYLYLTDDGQLFGTWDKEIPIQDILRFIEKNSHNQTSGIQQLVPSEGQVYIHYYKPKPRLIIFGADSDAKPLVSLAKNTGFNIIIADWREMLCNKYNFPEADQCITIFPKDIMSQIKFSPHDFVILMTHQFNRDKEILSLLDHQHLFYIGILGSNKRAKRLLGGKEQPASIHSPIGLPIGAEGPEEIAVSIMAEIIGKLRTNRIPFAFSSNLQHAADQQIQKGMHGGF